MGSMKSKPKPSNKKEWLTDWPTTRNRKWVLPTERFTNMHQYKGRSTYCWKLRNIIGSSSRHENCEMFGRVHMGRVQSLMLWETIICIRFWKCKEASKRGQLLFRPTRLTPCKLLKSIVLLAEVLLIGKPIPHLWETKVQVRLLI